MNQMTPMRTPAILFALTALLTYARPAAAQELTLEEAYAAVEAAAAQLESWSADVRMSINVMGMGMVMNYEGSMTGKGKLLKGELRGEVMDMKTSMKTTIDADGILWIETNTMGMNMVMKTDTKAMAEMSQEMMGLGGGMDMSNMGAQNPTQMLRVQGQMVDMAYLGTETREGIEVMLFGGPVKEEVRRAMADPRFGHVDIEKARRDRPGSKLAQLAIRMQYPFLSAAEVAFLLDLISMTSDRKAARKLVMAVGREDGFPREMIMETTADDPFMTMRFHYSNVATNIGVADEDFAYTPPEGVVVIDNVQLAQMGEMEAMQFLDSAMENAMMEMMAEVMPEVHTQFDAATMPEAAQVLRGSFETFAQKLSWKADAVLRYGEDALQLEFLGAMMGRRSLFRGEFSAIMGFGVHFLTVADAQGQFWTENRILGEADVEHYDTNTIEREEWAGQPMGVSPNRGPLSGASGLYDEMREVYDLSNLGVATADGAEVYVIEARLRDEVAGASISGMMDQPAEVFTMLIGVEDNLPRRLISRATDGKTLDLKLSNFEFGVELDDELFKYTPPPNSNVEEEELLEAEG